MLKSKKDQGLCVYLALAIDRNDAPDKFSKSLSLEIKKLSKNLGVPALAIFSPGRGYALHGVSPETDSYVIGINDFALSEADAVIAVYTPGLESWGLPQEVDKAWRNNIPVFVLYTAEECAPPPMYLRHKVTLTTIDLEILMETLIGHFYE